MPASGVAISRTSHHCQRPYQYNSSEKWTDEKTLQLLVCKPFAKDSSDNLLSVHSCCNLLDTTFMNGKLSGKVAVTQAPRHKMFVKTQGQKLNP